MHVFLLVMIGTEIMTKTKYSKNHSQSAKSREIEKPNDVVERDSFNSATMLWQYKMHEDAIFYQRLNFFLVTESMILVAFATLFSSPHPTVSWIRVVTAVLGCVVTLVWGYVGARQRNVMKQIIGEAEKAIPIYKKIRQERANWFSSTWLLAYFVPAIIFLTWAALIYLAIKM